MKKREYIFGLILLVLITFRLISFTGSSFLLVIGISLLSLIYMIFGFLIFNGIGFTKMFKKSSYENISGLRIAGAVLLGWICSITLSGISFKLSLWSGGEVLFALGLTTLGLAIAILLGLYMSKKENYLKQYIFRLLPIAIIALVIYLIPRSNLIEIYYRDNPEFGELYKDFLDNPDDLELREKFQKERQKLYE